MKRGLRIEFRNNLRKRNWLKRESSISNNGMRTLVVQLPNHMLNHIQEPGEDGVSEAKERKSSKQERLRKVKTAEQLLNLQ